jgi:quercetin dioxygenase-like cupin family protein
MRRSAFDPETFTWEGVTPRAYKDDPGTARGMAWQGLTRTTLVRAPEAGVSFEVRYFEISPGGFSSLEKHAHVHVVFAARGHGQALIGDQVVDLASMDLVETPPFAPHRWVNVGDEPFGFICTVEALRADPRTAPFVH